MRDITVSWITNSRSLPSNMRPPTLEYSPSVFSRTIHMSMSPGFKASPSRSTSGERMPGISRAGRRLTYWSNSRLNLSSEPHSEMWSGTVAGQPTAPKRIASMAADAVLPVVRHHLAVAGEVVAVGEVELVELQRDAEAPRGGVEHGRPSGITSRPMPSPAMTAMRWVVMVGPSS